MKDKLVDVLTRQIGEACEHIMKGANILVNGVGGSYAQGVQEINDLIYPIAMTILSILFLIDLIDMMTRKGDELRWEDVIRSLIKLLICKNIMLVAPTAMSAIYTTITNLIQQVGVSIDLSTVKDALRTTFEAEIPDDQTGIKQVINAISQIVSYISIYVNVLIVNLVSLVITVLCYGRAFELAVLEALSRIPIAFAGWGETKDVPKRFLMSYLGVCLQGLSIIVCFKIYTSILSGTPSSTMEFLLYTVALAVGIASSGKWAKDSLGLI